MAPGISPLIPAPVVGGVGTGALEVVAFVALAGEAVATAATVCSSTGVVVYAIKRNAGEGQLGHGESLGRGFGWRQGRGAVKASS